MEFPFGHNHSHTHHHRNDDEDDRERPPPPHLHHNEFAPPSHHHPPPPNHHQPPSFDGPYPPTPYPPVSPPSHHHPPPQHHHQPPSFDGPYPPTPYPPVSPPPSYFQQPGYDGPPPPPPHQPPHVTHVHHQQPGYDGPSPPYFQQPSFPSPPHQPSHVTHVHHSDGSSHKQQPDHGFRPNLPPEFHNKPTYKIYCRADPGYHLTIRDGHVILAPSDPSDEFQHWYKDEKFSTRVKDKVGFPSFSLVNKATGQAIKHSIGASHPVQLVPYKPDHLDESVLWSESLEVNDGYRAIRMINNIRLNVDAFLSDKKSGGVRNGTSVGLWQWNKGDNQIWKISPY